MTMINLKEAKKKGNLEEFIKEHEKDKEGDKDRLDKAIRGLSQDKQKSTQGTSQKPSP